MRRSCYIFLIQEDERQSDLIERKRGAGRASYLVKCPVVLKDEAHVPYEPLHLAVQLHNQLFLDFVQPHGLQSPRWLFTLLTKVPKGRLLMWLQVDLL